MLDNNKYVEMKEEIERRYAMFEEPLAYRRTNLVLDSYIPNLLRKNREYIAKYKYKIPSTAYTISEFFSSLFEVRQLPLKYMLQILNIDEKQLRKDLLTLKKQKMTLVLSGVGGTGANFIYWSEKLLEHFEIINLFKKVIAYDPEEVEFTNLIRIPFNPLELSWNDSRNKVNFLKINTPLSSLKTERLIKTLSFEVKDRNRFFLYNYTGFRVIDVDTEKKVMATKENTVIYGAPNIKMREEIHILEKKYGIKIPFVAGLHGDDEAELFLRPEANEDLQVESYGMIRLTSFFFNQLAMTIAFLRFLADENQSKWEQSGSLWKFNFKEFVKNGEAGTTKKKINYQLEHDGTMERGEL